MDNMNCMAPNCTKRNHRKVTAVVVGAGNRGKNYANYALQFPDLFDVVAVAEPRKHAREYFQHNHSLKVENCFVGWETLILQPKLADCAIVATQDQDHVKPTIKLAKIGYHILLEKPMAVTAEDCRTIYEACQEAGVMLAVCHVLRYHPPARKLKELIDSGLIGEVVNINHTEPVGFYHFAHSFVRGNWRNEKSSTFSLLAKCCHDVDLIAYWMGNKKCIKLSSFGSLHHFRKEKKPQGASARCLDCGIEESCPYSAKKIYLDPKPQKPQWPMSVVCDIEDAPEGYLARLTEAVRTGPYGKCVYDTDNDVCDNQVVNFEFSDGSTATLTMIAFTKQLCNRKTEVYGTLGQLVWDESKGHEIDHFDFLTRINKIHRCEQESPLGWGHGGADYHLIKSFVEAVALNDTTLISSGPKISLETHLLTFAAEHSRLSSTIVRPNADSRWMVQ
ncbi:putative oxidoreductase YteT isoform X1 [Palaemon carinicauda]|uniref:putative oxidoreductase YteT isoform X1 n=1 Tax=Palaemon carinicauda TaxID=392227 RepID=UPI0035B67626